MRSSPSRCWGRGWRIRRRSAPTGPPPCSRAGRSRPAIDRWERRGHGRRTPGRRGWSRSVTASIEVAIDAVDVDAAVEFWRAALGYRVLYERDPYVVLGPDGGDTRPRLVVQRVDQLNLGKTPVHMDLRVDDPDREV